MPPVLKFIQQQARHDDREAYGTLQHGRRLRPLRRRRGRRAQPPRWRARPGVDAWVAGTVEAGPKQPADRAARTSQYDGERARPARLVAPSAGRERQRGRLRIERATGLPAWKRGQPGQVGNEAALTVVTSAGVRLVTLSARPLPSARRRRLGRRGAPWRARRSTLATAAVRVPSSRDRRDVAHRMQPFAPRAAISTDPGRHRSLDGAASMAQQVDLALLGGRRHGLLPQLQRPRAMTPATISRVSGPCHRVPRSSASTLVLRIPSKRRRP